MSLLHHLLGSQNGFLDWGIGRIYYGSVYEWIYSKRKGRRKKSNFDEIYRLDHVSKESVPMKYILIGDTGEYDERGFELIVEEYSHSIQAVFLHVVGSDSHQPNLLDNFPDKVYHDVPFFYFRTYTGAALKAYQYGLVDLNGIKAVLTHSLATLSLSTKGSSNWSLQTTNSIEGVSQTASESPISQIQSLRQFVFGVRITKQELKEDRYLPSKLSDLQHEIIPFDLIDTRSADKKCDI